MSIVIPIPSPKLMAEIAKGDYDPSTPALFERDHLKVRAVEQPDFVVWSTRGTEPEVISEWIRDFDQVGVYYGGLGSMPQGLLYSLLSCVEPLSLAAEKLQKPLWLGGHSFGASFAESLACMFLLRGVRVSGCTVFAPFPWVSDKDDGPLTLFKPFSGRSFAYPHDEVPTKPGWRRHPRDMTVLPATAGATNWIQDHSIDTYIEAAPET